ncbi:hypothetical protein KR054_012450, partial [Drosophila jambulina]
LDFTNIKCTSLDKDFSEFGYCYLKAQNRTYKYLSLRVILYQIPVPQFKVNFALYKRSNGLSPVSYNLTVDGCKLVADHQSPWVNFLFGLFKDHSNINHTCPFDVSLYFLCLIYIYYLKTYSFMFHTLQHDIIVEKLPAQLIFKKFNTFLPFMEGDYVFSSNWIVHGINRVHVRVHLSYT